MEQDPGRQVGLFAADVRQIIERVGPVFEIMRAAARSEAAAETAWAITGPELFRLLTADLGWPSARRAQRLAETLARILLS